MKQILSWLLHLSKLHQCSQQHSLNKVHWKIPLRDEYKLNLSLKDMQFWLLAGYRAVTLKSLVSSILSALSQSTEMSDVARYNYFIKVIAKLCYISIILISCSRISVLCCQVLKAREVSAILESDSISGSILRYSKTLPLVGGSPTVGETQCVRLQRLQTIRNEQKQAGNELETDRKQAQVAKRTKTIPNQ